MSTNSTISVKVGKEIRSVYCHWDGYISHHGPILTKFYDSQEKAESLVALGDISGLNKSIECPEGHSFDNPIDGYSVFYGRDRGEEDVNFRTYKKFKNVPKEQYNYFWNGTKWTCNGNAFKVVEK